MDYVGIDLHKTSSQVCLLSEDDHQRRRELEHVAEKDHQESRFVSDRRSCPKAALPCASQHHGKMDNASQGLGSGTESLCDYL